MRRLAILSSLSLVSLVAACASQLAAPSTPPDAGTGRRDASTSGPDDLLVTAAPDLGVADLTVADPPDLVTPPPPPDLALSIRDRCFPGLGDPQKGVPNYDQFGAVVGTHCGGTDHQT